MKKGLSVFWTIVSVLMIIGAIECGIVAAVYTGDQRAIENVSDISISDIDEHTVLYVEKLEVLERYAFQTVDEYQDSEGSYSDTTYYVYPASHPMDKHTLFAEYYIVKFTDKTGKEYVASLTVSAEDDIASSLRNTPLQIGACVGAAPYANSAFSNTNDKQLAELREASLKNYSQHSQAESAQITLGYRAASIAQYEKAAAKDAASTRVLMAVLAVALLAGTVWLIGFVRRKKQKG